MVTKSGDKGAVSRADLLRCLLDQDSSELDGMAKVLGFGRVVQSNKIQVEQDSNTAVEFTQRASSTLSNLEQETDDSERNLYYRITEVESIGEAENTESGYPEWLETSNETLLDAGRQSLVPKQEPFTFEPLVSWSRLWPFLHKALSRSNVGMRPDIDSVVKKLSSGELLKKIPLQTRNTWSGKAVLLVDINQDTFSFRKDFIYLKDKLISLRGEQGLQVCYLEDQPGGDVYYWEREEEIVSHWKMPEPSIPLLIISDLGLLAQSKRVTNRWLVFGREQTAKGCRPIVLMPVPQRMIDSRLLKYFECVVWDRGSSLKPVKHTDPNAADKSERHKVLTEALLGRLAPAITIDNALLRSARYIPSDEHLDVGHEAAVWRHPAIVDFGDEFGWQVSDYDKFLDAFSSLPTPEQKSLVALIARSHANYPEVIFFEAMQNCLQAALDSVEFSVKNATRRYLEALIRTQIQEPNYQGLDQWSGRYRVRQSSEIQGKDNDILAASWGLYLKKSAGFGEKVRHPENVDLSLMRLFMVEGTRTTRHELRLYGTHFIFSPEVEKDLGEFGKQGVLLGSVSSNANFFFHHQSLIRFHNSGFVEAAEAGRRKYRFSTDREKIVVEALIQPSWAMAVGHDAQGLYAESQNQKGEIYRWYWNPPIRRSLTTMNIKSSDKTTHAKSYRGFWYSKLLDRPKSPEIPTWADSCIRDELGLKARVTLSGTEQWFRWIEPVTFQMGSPETEAGRYERETQHEVRLTQGYWIADTACTQDVWQAVMKENPSKFQGKSRPVETISWDDIQIFLHLSNQQKFALNLRLPTEAEWENSCRAGSIGAFNFDDEPSLKRINYRGTWDHYDEWKEEALQQTSDVKKYRPNAWGLYEMHGNVMEWCEDWFEPFTNKLSFDPKGPEKGESRVLRGGSWVRRGRLCRSAFRNRGASSERDVNFGLRLAHSHDCTPVRSTFRSTSQFNRNKPRVFISYGSEEGDKAKEVAQPLYSLLKKENVNVFLDENSILPGDQWLSTLRESLNESMIVLLLISSASHLTKKEYDRAVMAGKKVIPILTEDIPLPPYLKHLQVVRLFGRNTQSEKARLIGEVLNQIN